MLPFHEKASSVKANVVAGSVPKRKQQPYRHASIRTLVEPVLLDSVHDGVRPVRSAAISLPVSRTWVTFAVTRTGRLGVDRFRFESVTDWVPDNFGGDS